MSRPSAADRAAGDLRCWVCKEVWPPIPTPEREREREREIKQRAWAMLAEVEAWAEIHLHPSEIRTSAGPAGRPAAPHI